MTKKGHLIKSLLALSLIVIVSLAAYSTVAAQDTELPQTFTAETGLSIGYPDGWIAREGDDGIEIANSAETLDAMNNDDDIKPGQAAMMAMGPIPAEELGGMPVATVVALFSSGMTNETEEVEVSEVEELTINDLPAARVNISDPEADIDAFLLGLDFDGTLVLAIGVAYQGELTDIEPTLLAMAESITVKAITAIEPEDIQADLGVVVVGTNAEYPPFEYVDENGEIAGFDVDLVDALAERAGFEVERVNTRWDGIFVALQSGEFDMVASAATITEEREEIIDFSNPYFYANQRIAVLEANADDIQSPEDLAGLRVGVQAGTTGDIYASEEVPGAEVVRYDEITLAFQALASGDVDAILNDGPTSADIIAKNPDMNALLVGEPLSEEFYGIAVQPDQPELLDAVNAALAEIIADGTYAEIHIKWFEVEPDAMFMPAE